MYQKLLLPVDLTDRHERAIEAAIELAPDEVVLLHVIETIPGLTAEEQMEFYGRLETLSQQQVQRLAQPLLGVGVPCQGEVVYGHRETEVLNYARDNQIDLIVLTSPQFDQENFTGGAGSLIWKISLLSPCAVLLVK